MAARKFAKNKGCSEPDSRSDRDGDCSGAGHWKFDPHHDSHFGHNNRDSPERDDWQGSGRPGRCNREPDVDLDRNRDGIDLGINMDMQGKNLRVDIDLGCRDLKLKIDACQLQPDNDPVATLIGGEGNAVGEQTLVDADIFSRLIDLGSITVAFGVANFESTAISGEGLAYAAADTFADVSGADIVFIFTEKASGGDGELLSATEVSRTAFVAVDFEEFDLRGGPLVFNYDDIDLFTAGGIHSACTGSGNPQIEGNVALLNVDALAQAENTLVDVASSVLTVEDQLSSVSAVVVTAVA